jgi:hypothetical protein
MMFVLLTTRENFLRPRNFFQSTLTRLRGRSRSYFSIWRRFGAAKARPEATLSHRMGEGRGEGIFPSSILNLHARSWLRPGRAAFLVVASFPKCGREMEFFVCSAF